MESEICKENLIPLVQHNNLMELFPKAFNVKNENFKMTPSEFIREMNLTTQERHKNLVQKAGIMKTSDSGYPPQFRVIPNILMFQKFEARSTYFLVLEVKNTGKTLLPLKMHCPDSVYFSARHVGTPRNKLAPGLSVEYEVSFTPNEAKDYSHHLVFKSQEIIFHVPIIAIGPRAMLDIPDRILLDSAPVKIPQSKIIVVQNIGDAAAVFNLIADSDRFRVSPSKGVLGVRESMMLGICFESSRPGGVTEPLHLLLETGEKLEITLHGSAENIGVRLNKSSVSHEDTFMGLKRCKVVRIINGSSHLVKFSWKKNMREEEDLEVIEKIKEKYKDVSEAEIRKDAKVTYYDLGDAQKHKLSCERILNDELRLLNQERIGFFHEAFQIVPENGEVWPKGTTEVTVAFEPKVCGPVSATAYLEIGGRDSRLPLRIRGNGLGPAIILTVKTLDIDYIYLCSLHKYEVIAENRGDIPGTIEYVAEPLVFGGKVEVAPQKRRLEPSECAAFVVSFTSNRQGEFTEKLPFVIKESGDPVFLTLKGKIVSPTLYFETRQVDFGVIPVGFPEVREVTLDNLSMVPVMFSLKVMSDGEGPSLSYDQFAKLTEKPALPHSPKEFHIEPQESVVEPFSSKKVTLTLTANSVRQCVTHLVVDMWNSENGSVSCPILFQSRIATLVARPDVIAIPFCFINFPYTRSITLRNVSDVAAFFYVVPSNPRGESSTTCSASVPQGVVEPRGSTKIDITVVTSALGRQVAPIKLVTFGDEMPREACLVSCVGRGPVVTVTPDSINWGDLPLLQEDRRTLVVSNESPIPAAVAISLAKSNSPWTVHPSNLTLAPEESVDVVVGLLLNNRQKFRDNLKINVHNGNTLQVSLAATGVGSCLRTSPDIKPRYDLGTLFSHKKYEFEVSIANDGVRAYGLVWSPFPDYKTFAKAKFVAPQENIFKIEPPKTEVLPGEKRTVSVEVQSTSRGFFHQTFYCFSNAERPARELLFTSDVCAEFVEPFIGFDKTEIQYWYNVGSEGTEQKLRDTVSVTNLSVLSICVEVSVVHPFALDGEDQECCHRLTVNLDGNETKELTVRFLAAASPDKRSQTYNQSLEVSFKEHSKKRSVALKGEVNYPNVVVLPKTVDFSYVPVGADAYREICLVNVSPLKVHYEVQWKSSASQISYPEECAVSETSKFADHSGEPEERCGEWESGRSLTSNEEAADQSEEELVPGEHSDEAQDLPPPAKPVPKMPEITVSKSDVRAALFPLARNYYRCEEESADAYRMDDSSDADGPRCPPGFANVCDVTPFYGSLEAFASQVLAVRFRANAPMDARLEALLKIASGPSEEVKIRAKSCEVRFALAAVDFDFGKQLFCQTESQVLKIENRGAAAFSYEARTKAAEECDFEGEFPPGIGVLTVSPAAGRIDACSQAELSIGYHPGVPGQFEDDFLLQIAHLEPTTIRVRGFGVFPQVHVSLPRPDMLNVPHEVGYAAVANITRDWFLSGVAAPDSSRALKPCRSQESNPDGLSAEEEADPEEDDWESFKTLECLPSEVDVQLAIERTLALDLTKNESANNAAFAVYARTIPRFQVPAYVIDFGVAVIGRTLERSVTVTNHGPLPAVVYGVFDPHLREEGIHVRLKNRNELGIGASLSFAVSFGPRKRKYRKKIQDVRALFYFEVYHGPKIPIKVLAEVTYPHLIPSISTLNFCQVVCGCCKIMSLRVKNPGLVAAFWSLAFAAKCGDPCGALPQNGQDGRSMFHPNQTSGSLDPEQYCSIQISFKPEREGRFFAVLCILVAESLEEIKVMLSGEGMEPRLNVSHRILEFEPTLPYPHAADKVFVVENPCSFPVEFYFPAFDEQILEEEKILRAMANFYETNEILMPVRKAGDGLPPEFVNFYHMLLEDLNAKWAEAEREKADRSEENVCVEFLDAEDSAAAPERKRRSGKTLSGSRTAAEARRASSAAFEAPQDPSSNILLERKTSREIEEMLMEHIGSIPDKELVYDPVQAAIRNVVPPLQEEEYREGTLVVFHGAPFTDSVQWANRAALLAGVRALGIDGIVLEEAALGRCPAGLRARELIEEAYWDHVRVPEVEPRDSSTKVEDEEDFDFVKEHEEIQRKFAALAAVRESLLAGKGKAAKGSSAKSDGSKKLEKGTTPNPKPMNLNAPLANITEELVLDILKFRLPAEAAEGVILEGLGSAFVDGCAKALATVLRAVGNLRDILVVFLLNSYAEHTRHASDVQAEQENLKFNLREELLNVLEEEPDEVFQSLELNQEEAEQMRSIFISRRRELQNLFEKKKESFYEMEKLKKKALKSGLPVPLLPLGAKFGDSADKWQKDQKDKEKKKDVAKAVRTSDVSGRSGSEAKSAKNKRDSIEGEFLAFESELIEMTAIVEGWDQRPGAPITEVVPEAKPKKGQTPRKPEMPPETKEKGGRGIFLWLADVSDPVSNCLPSVCCHLRGILEERRAPDESDGWPLESTDSVTFSVAACPPFREKSVVAEAFTICSADAVLLEEDYSEDFPSHPKISSSSPLGGKLNDSASQISLRGKRKGQSAVQTKRRGTESRMSVDVKNVKARNSLSAGVSECPPMKSRWVLRPGESTSYCVRYFPVEVGRSEQTLEINVVNWEKGNAIQCAGTCDIPALDARPEAVFPAVANFRPLEGSPAPAYFYSDDAYDFGSVIALQGSETKGTEKTAAFALFNKSTLPVDLTVILAQDAAADGSQCGSPHIKFQPENLFLRPGERRPLIVTAKPTKDDSVLEVLMLLVKDNPRVEMIRVQCEGVKPNVTVDPKCVNFDRLLLHRRVCRRVVFTNNNSIPLFVQLSGVEDLPPQFSFSEVAGWIPPLGTLVVEIRYDATEVQLVSEQPLQAKVFDSLEAEEPVQEVPFNVSAEAYDAALDVIFSSREDDHIDFGETPVEKACARVFNLKNVGKYPLGFRALVESRRLADSEKHQFFVDPQEGKLLPGKPFPLTANFAAQNEVLWRRLPLVQIVLVEPCSADEVVANIPIEVSARSFFARYEIKPQPDFNFGPLRAGSTTTASLLIENRGRFPLSFSIEQRPTSETREAREERVPSKPSASSKEKGDKGKKPPPSTLAVGAFEICPRTGVADVEETAVVRITCRPGEPRAYEEKVTVFVGDSPPHLKKGSPLAISAEGCLPAVGFRDFKTVFREHFVFKNESELRCRPKVGAYTSFTEDDASFAFKNATVGKTTEARIRLPNSGLIECRVTASVCPPEDDPGKAPRAPEGERHFDVSPENLVIEPYASGTLTLTFRPETLEVYRARLKMSVEMPDGWQEVVEVINLWGNGVLPQIEITEPTSRLPGGETLVNFPPTSPGHRSTAAIAFTNVGPIDCQVILELYEHQDGVFALTPKPDTEKMLKAWELAKPIEHAAIASVSPGQVAEFAVSFGPKESQPYSSQIKLFVVDNPFENWRFRLVGDVLFEEVVVEKIRTGIPFLPQEGTEPKFAIGAAPGEYLINFGDCFIKKKMQALLRLTNKTDNDIFRFEWEGMQSVTTSPSTGHLYPNSYKEVLLTFYPEEPVSLNEVPIGCTVNKILVEDPPEVSWDSRLFLHQKLPDLEASASPRPLENKESPLRNGPHPAKLWGEEPAFDLVLDSERMLFVRVSATADYARLACEATNIRFKQTFMFQTRTYPLNLENVGSIALDYKLSLKSVIAWPLRENKMSQVGDSLMKVQRPRSRPQSSLRPISGRSRQSTEAAPECPCARPLTSGSLLDLKKPPSEPWAGEAYSVPTPRKATAYNPFGVENSSGHILPKEKVACNITFSPMDIQEYKAVLCIRVANLHPECFLPEIEVTASSLLPHCHFNIPESDYLESGRRDFSRPGPVGYAPGIPLHPDTKAIEIKVLGVGETVPVKFHVINPTEDDQAFSWANVTQVQADVVQSFYCSTSEGRIQGGRQQLMVFHFVSQRVGISESFWKFCLPKHGVETPFLFVADVREPAVCCLANHLNLRPTCIGSTSSDRLTLVNHEETPFEFRFLPESLCSEAGLKALEVEPLSGTIPANSEVDVRITFVGTAEGKLLFRLKCKVARVKEPFVVSVEAVTYAVQPLLSFEDPKKIRHSADPAAENVIDFGTEMSPDCPETVTLTFTSLSGTSFYYEWEFDEKFLESRFCKLGLSVKNGHVTSHSRGKCDLTLVFHKKSSLVNFPVRLKVRRGPTFKFKVNASVTTPPCAFSFLRHDFGYCFVQERNVCFNEVLLFVRNKDGVDIVLQCASQASDAFSFALPEAVIPPNNEIAVPIHFHPRECIQYEEAITFSVNGVHERIVRVKGHGADFKVNLADPEDTTVDLGAVRAGKTSVRRFSLVNNSLCPATLLVGFSDQLPVNSMCLARPLENFVDLSENHRLSGTLAIRPSTAFAVKPREVYFLEAVYSPESRSGPFSETVSVQFQERVEPLCVVTGCCLGPEISFDRNVLNFGAVVRSCSSTLKLRIVNSGSIGARFEWRVKSFRDEYFISPASGYCCPESDVTVQVTFCPSDVKNCIKDEAECQLFLPENETYPSLFLSLIGDCVDLPEPLRIISFKCFVRENDAASIEIENSTGSEWRLVPSTNGDYFKGHEALVVPSLSTARYEITYRPLTMTQPGEFHEGATFFRLPNGQGLLYRLRGTSLPPDPEDVIAREVPCKTKYVELLKVGNWLQHPQRFKANISCVSGEAQNLVWSCTGFQNLELPPLGLKDYGLNFFAYNVGSLRFHVSFVNEETKEYLWYDITFNVVTCEPLEVITLRSGVRQSCKHQLRLDNPLDKTIQYKLETTSSEIHFESQFYEVPPEESIYVELSFLPIHPREQSARLTAACPELGDFPRELRLISVDVPPDPPRTFETPLGTSQTQEILLKNLSNSNAVLRCRTDAEDFVVGEQATVAAGQSASVLVTHEPSHLGPTTATLFVESEQAGNFTFPLLGLCAKPEAKGPFVMRQGSGVNIPFKNVFRKAKEFHMYVDNPAFFLKSPSESIPPREETNIYVALGKSKRKDRDLEPGFPIAGQLVVECFNPYVRWQFYLKGLLQR